MNASSDADLLRAYLDGDLPPEKTARLQARLKSEPRLADLLLILANDETVLHEWASVERAAHNVGMRMAADGIDGGCGEPSAPQRPRRRRWVVVLLAAASVAAAVFAAWTYFGRSVGAPGRASPVGPEVATHKISAGACLAGLQGDVALVTAAGQFGPAREGADLFSGQEVRTTGEGSQAVVRFADGTRLELGADTALRLEDAGAGTAEMGKRVFLLMGLLEGVVAPQPQDRPLVLSTSYAAIRVLGTRFRSIASPDATRVELEEGRVQMTRLSDGQSVTVEKGGFAVATQQPQPMAVRPLPPQAVRPREVVELPNPVALLAFSPDGDVLAIAAWDGTISLWDRRTEKVRLTFQAHPQRPKAMAYSPDGAVLASGGLDKVIKYWDPASGESLPFPFSKQPTDVNGLAFSPDGRTLAGILGFGKGGKGSEQIVLWDARTGKELGRLPGHDEPILSLAFAPDGKTLATAGKDGVIKFWDVEGRREKLVIREQVGEVRTLTYSPDGKRLATAGKDRVIRIRDTQTGEVRLRLEVQTSDVLALAFSPDGRLLADSGGDSVVRLWDPASGQDLRDFRGHRKGPIPGLAFSPDGKRLATGGRDRRVMLWDLKED